MKDQLLKPLHQIVSLDVEFIHTKTQVPINFLFLTNSYFLWLIVLLQGLKLSQEQILSLVKVRSQ